MEKILLLYFAVVSLFAIIVTCADKLFAKHHMWRIPEKTLMTVSALGGSVAMYLTMQLIRHKTKKPLFMVGIPIIMACQLIIAAALYFLGVKLW